MRIRKDAALEKDDILLIARASDALAHPGRVEIFRFIYNENLARHLVCNKDIVEEFDYAQATVSQHMRKLVFSGLVDVQKKETYSYYYVNIGMLGRFLNAVRKLND